MERQNLQSSNGASRGTLIDAAKLTNMFAVSLNETGYVSEYNGATSVNQTVTLVAKTIWGDGHLNKAVKGASFTGADGLEVKYDTSSKKEDKSRGAHTLNIVLPKATFGTAVFDNTVYTSKDSQGKAEYADWIFHTRTFLKDYMAKTSKEIREIKKLLTDKARVLGLIVNVYDAIDMTNPEIQQYWKAELASRFESLKERFSIQALITAEGSPFKGAQIYAKPNGDFTRYNLYIG